MRCKNCGVKIVGKLKTKKIYIKDGKVYAEPLIIREFTIYSSGKTVLDRVIAKCPVCDTVIGEKSVGGQNEMD